MKGAKRALGGRERIGWWVTVLTACLGFLASAGTCYIGWINTPIIKPENLCLILEDDFTSFSTTTPSSNSTTTPGTWTQEVSLSGFGNGEFEMTTTSPNNTFVFGGFVYNVTGCTDVDNFEGTACGAVSNETTGTVINPVMSGRLTTRLSHSIRYGKVEIRAKAPKGDWLWPALWMLPVDNVYGPWPLSGEIDIMESRGNGPTYAAQGDNVVRGSLNWGPTVLLNAVSKTFGWWSERRTTYADAFHVYTLEWTSEFLRIYVDTRLHLMLYLPFNEPFFTRGHFPDVVQNGSQTVALQNPWAGHGNTAPFDQPFYLIMDVAVGGTNGWFPDNVGNKPWVDGSRTAMRDFALAQDEWYPTWPEDPAERAMVVDYVKMWQLC
ncbi:glycoside hydrolase family 16 protein [Ramaria rubella]|nr:glycoside hydrolase family 16 protein [Ramaria rubella]